MILKIVSLFLVAMAVLALFGRLRVPGTGGRRTSFGRARPAICPRCGRYRIGSGPCPCDRR